MKAFEEKMEILLQVCTYGLAAFGGLMLCGYILCFIPPARDYIPMAAISQSLIYIGGVSFAILISLTDFIFEKLSDMIRIGIFFLIIYVLGITFFQMTSPNRPFDSILRFIGFSFWIVGMSSIALGGWLVYQYCINKKYNICLTNYQKNLIESEHQKHE